MSAIWKRAHEFGQPFTWIRISSSSPGSRAASSSASHRARPFVSPIASLQNSIPVHAITPLRNGSGVAGRSSASSSSTSSSALGRLDAGDHELLLRRGSDATVAEPVGEVGDQAQLVAAHATGTRREPDRHAARRAAARTPT